MYSIALVVRAITDARLDMISVGEFVISFQSVTLHTHGTSDKCHITYSLRGRIPHCKSTLAMRSTCPCLNLVSDDTVRYI